MGVKDDIGEFVKWSGRGPAESYNDKKESQKVSVYRLPFEGLDYHMNIPKKAVTTKIQSVYY